MRKWLGVCALLGAALLTGCGAGGGGTSATGETRAVVLLTDSFREDYAHVWATIHRVELVPQSGSALTLFEDTAGKQIDLKTLRDSSGERFSFLGSATIPAGTYTAIKVTVGATMQLFRNGVATGDPLTVDTSLPKDANGNPILTNTFTTPKTLTAGTNNLIVDFDLARFVIRNSNVIPVIKEGATNGVRNFARHNCDEYHGAVSALTGTSPDLTFTLTRRDGSTVQVQTTASTAIYGTETLANGSAVQVTGTLDTTTQILVATALHIRSATEAQRPNSAFGVASSLNATAGTFVLTVNRARGFTPAQTTLNVTTTSATAFRIDSGQTATQAEFFTALATTSNVLVTGTYDSTSNTFTATAAKIMDTTQDGGWERGSHRFRRGASAENWGNGLFRR